LWFYQGWLTPTLFIQKVGTSEKEYL